MKIRMVSALVSFPVRFSICDHLRAFHLRHQRANFLKEDIAGIRRHISLKFILLAVPLFANLYFSLFFFAKQRSRRSTT